MSCGRLMISAAGSGHGKSVVTMGLLEAMKERGLSVQSFKCGPDYIDPRFHERVLGICCRNLDTYLMGREEVLEEVESAESKGSLCVAEGAMGLMDGLGRSSEHSAYSIARLCRMKVLVVLDAGRTDRNCIRQMKDLLDGDSERIIAGALINRCLAEDYAPLAGRLEEMFRIAVCGFLPPMKEAQIPSRHLGLVGAAEAEDFSARVQAIARELEKSGSVERVLELVLCSAKDAAGREQTCSGSDSGRVCRIAVARDEAFAFLYQRSLDNLERAGARLCFFSPLHDTCLPDGIGGLYLPGGYPELYASSLEQNQSMRRAVREAVQSGLPTVAECGGFLYLGQELCGPDSTPFRMAGVFGGTASNQGKLVRFGYLEILQDQGDSLLLREGESMTAHEFHYWDSTQNGNDLVAVKRSKNRTWRFGYASPVLYAGFPHICLDRVKAGRFVSACADRSV